MWNVERQFKWDGSNFQKVKMHQKLKHKSTGLAEVESHIVWKHAELNVRNVEDYCKEKRR